MKEITAMKTGRILKTFSALSFDAGQLTAGAVPTPENVRDFTVPKAGLADVGSPHSGVPARNELANV